MTANAVLLPDDARCLGCRYHLRGLPTPVCPECGRAFDPANASTFRTRSSTTWWRTWAQPPPLLHCAFTLAVAGTLLTRWSIPEVERLVTSFPKAAGVGFAIVSTPLILLYALHIAAARADVLPERRNHAMTRRRPWRWLVLPVAAALVLVTFAFNWPLWLRFACSRPAMEAEAQRLLRTWKPGTSPTVQPVERYLGLYYVESAEVDPVRGEVWIVLNDWLFEANGFVYAPRSSPGRDVGLPAPWYAWMAD